VNFHRHRVFDHVQNASLVTLEINTGPDGDNDPRRTPVSIQAAPTRVTEADAVAQRTVGPMWRQRFAGLATAARRTNRVLYF
jgi:hypothetical protein